MVQARRSGDLIAAVILWAISAILWWETTTWPAAADAAGDPTVMPRALAIIMALAGLVLVIRTRPAPDEDDGGSSHRPLDTLLAVAATIGFALLLDPLGLIPAGMAYVLILQRLVGAPWRTAIPFAVATPIIIWLIFVTALHVPLPRGEILSLPPWI
jgi:putative tricarboxylic transport membrane protein